MVLGALISALIFEMTSAFTVILMLTFMFSTALLFKFRTISFSDRIESNRLIETCMIDIRP
jgi:hypothetical protein